MELRYPSDTDSILVVEDDAPFPERLHELLVGSGFRVGCVENGREALDVIRAGARPSMILLDLNTPDMDGLEFRRRQLPAPDLAQIPVIVFTGGLSKEEEAKTLGVSFYLKKPVPFDQIVEVVRFYAGGADSADGSRGDRARMA